MQTAISQRLTGYSSASQVTAQINAAIASGIAANVSGVVAVAQGGTGATTAAAARANLQLGDAAARQVGTVAGTVAAGDDSRILAAQTASQVGNAVAAGLAGYSTASQVTAQIAAAVAAGTAANVSGVVAVAHGGTGADNAADARAFLGLGPAATLPVGTTANTVAAGNDARILAARTASQVDAAIMQQLAGYLPAQSPVAQGSLGVEGSLAARDNVYLNGSGTPNGANVWLTGNGSVTPRKTVRAIDGQLQVVNDAYSAVILSLTDDGSLSCPALATSDGPVASRAYVAATYALRSHPVFDGSLKRH